MDDVGYGDAGHGVEFDVAANVSYGLEDGSADGRVLQTEFQDCADLIGVHVSLDGGDEDGGHAGVGEAVEGTNLGFQERLAANGEVGVLAEAVELEVDDGVEGGHGGEESIVVGEADAVGVDHDLADATVAGGLDHLGQLGVDGGLAAAELDDLGVAFDFDETVEHGLDLFQGKVVTDAGVSEANGAIEVAGGVDLDEGEADVLLVLRAEAAVEGAAVFDLGAEVQGDGAGLVESDAADVHLGVGADDALEPAVLWAAFSHVDLVVADDYLGIDDGFAFGADGPGEFVEDIVGVLFDAVIGGQLGILLIREGW